MAVNKISDENLFLIKKKSAKALPDKPSSEGYTAEQIKDYLSSFVVDEENSIKSEIDRIVDEVNVNVEEAKNYADNSAVDESVGQFVTNNPILNLSINEGILSYNKYNTETNGTLDIVRSDSAFLNSNDEIKNKSGSVIYPKTSINKLVDKIDNKTIREYIISLNTALNTMNQKHNTDIATINTNIQSILGGNAPQALDTIRELAQALKDNPETIDDILLSISNLDSGKVDKVVGKQLSTNDFTDILKASLDALNQRELANISDIPTTLNSFTEDSTHRTVTDTEKSNWNSKANGTHNHLVSEVTNLQSLLDSKSNTTHSHTPQSLGAEVSGTASSLLNEHNTNDNAHTDIRELISTIENKVDGRYNAITFYNELQLTDWINGSYTREDGISKDDLFIGQNIYLEEQTQSDYWVSSIPVNSISDLSVLVTDKINLSEYALISSLSKVATSNNYGDLSNKPFIPTALSQMIEDESHKTITQEKLNLIDTNASNIELKLNKNLGASESNKMVITDSYGNLTTAEAGAMSILIDNLESTSTTMAPTANQARVLNNIKLDKQQGVENKGKAMFVDNDGLLVPDEVEPKIQSLINSHNVSSSSHSDIRALINNLSEVASSGDYSDLLNKPSIPIVTNDLTNDLKSNYDIAYTHSQSEHAPSNAQKNVQSNWNEESSTNDAFILNKPNLSNVALSGSYDDLLNKPSIPIVTNDLTDALKNRYDVAYTHSQSEHAPLTEATTSAKGLMSSSDKTNLNANTSARHTHSNKSVLDTITASKLNMRHYLSGDSGRTSGVYTYYALASFPTDNSSNSCSLTIDGRIGGWNNGNKGYLSMMISNRDGISASGTLLGNAALSLCDLVVYTSGSSSSGSTATLYLKTYSWFAFDLTLGTMSGTSDIYTGVGTTTTPSGTLQWSLLSNKNKFLQVKDGGEIYMDGFMPATVIGYSYPNGSTSYVLFRINEEFSLGICWGSIQASSGSGGQVNTLPISFTNIDSYRINSTTTVTGGAIAEPRVVRISGSQVRVYGMSMFNSNTYYNDVFDYIAVGLVDN